MWGIGVWMGVEGPCPPVRNDIVTRVTCCVYVYVERELVGALSVNRGCPPVFSDTVTPFHLFVSFFQEFYYYSSSFISFLIFSILVADRQIYKPLFGPSVRWSVTKSLF